MSASAATWTDSKQIDLNGLRLTLSTPVAVGRSRGYFWFPNLWQMPTGDLFSTISPVSDSHLSTIPYLATWSRDGGLSWSEPIVLCDGGQTLLQLEDGDALLLPYILRPQAEGIGAPYNRITAGTRTLTYVPTGTRILGLPQPDQSYVPVLGTCGFAFNGQTLQRADGSYLATIYGRFMGDSRYTLIALTSTDGETWQMESAIAAPDCPLPGRDGPCESAISRLADGRILCVFRMGSNVPFGQAWSSDEGQSWTPATAMAGPFSVQPSLAVMADGTVALSGGRPGLHLWLDHTGSGMNWQALDLLAHHDACHPAEPIVHTSAYTEVVAVDESHLLVMYDRLANQWQPIPEEMEDTNSVWLVRVAVEKGGG